MRNRNIEKYETGRGHRSQFGKHLQSIHNYTSGFPVAPHFNSTGHCITDVQVQGMHVAPTSCTSN